METTLNHQFPRRPSHLPRRRSPLPGRPSNSSAVAAAIVSYGAAAISLSSWLEIYHTIMNLVLGSIMGPLFFLSYFSHMVKTCRGLDLVLFDTNILAEGRDLAEICGSGPKVSCRMQSNICPYKVHSNVCTPVHPSLTPWRASNDLKGPPKGLERPQRALNDRLNMVTC